MKHYLVQRIDCICCERLNVEQKYFGTSQEDAKQIYSQLIHDLIKDKCKPYKDYYKQYYDFNSQEELEEKIYEEKIEKDIDETSTYWEYCNDDGDDIVIMIQELEAQEAWC